MQVNTQLLIETQGGKKLRKLTKHQDINIRGNAAELLNVWKSVVSNEAAAVEKGKEQLGDQPCLDLNICSTPSMTSGAELAEGIACRLAWIRSACINAMRMFSFEV